MAKVVRYRPQHAESEWTARLGMIVFLGSWGMMFGSLFFAYGIVRSRSPVWPPPDLPRPPLLVPAVATAVLGASSWLLKRALASIGRDRIRGGAAGIGGAAALGVLFLALQVSVWVALYERGLSLDSGSYASVFYALTCFHGLHVAVGLIALTWLFYRALVGRYNAARHLPVRLWAMYWHFVGVVWGAMFVAVYLI
jgi:cytochrome c oxidase subunit 3